MDKKYIIDIRSNDKDNDFILEIGNININTVKTLDLDINKSLVSFKQALDREDLEEAYNILNIIRGITEYGDKKLSAANILFKIKDITLFYKNMDTNSIIDSMNILFKIRRFFWFLNSQITFEYTDENARFIENIKKIRDSIDIRNLIGTNVYKEYDPSIIDLKILTEFKETFNDKNYDLLEDVYIFFEGKIKNKIETLKTETSENTIKIYKDILRNKYEDSFYQSNEFKNLVFKNNIDNIRDLIVSFDNCYLIYKFNNEIYEKEKEDILTNLLLNNFVVMPRIYRNLIIENIIKGKKQYSEIDSFFNDVNKNLESIREEKRLNAIMV